MYFETVSCKFNTTTLQRFYVTFLHRKRTSFKEKEKSFKVTLISSKNSCSRVRDQRRHLAPRKQFVSSPSLSLTPNDNHIKIHFSGLLHYRERRALTPTPSRLAPVPLWWKIYPSVALHCSRHFSGVNFSSHRPSHHPILFRGIVLYFSAETSRLAIYKIPTSRLFWLLITYSQGVPLLYLHVRGTVETDA